MNVINAITVRNGFALFAVFIGAIFLSGNACAQAITVPNGDFSSAANNGTVGGLVGSYTAVTLGTGPWAATGSAVGSNLGLPVLAPVTTIGSGRATFSSLIGISAVVNNSAILFNNNIGSTFVAGKTYTLTADFSSTSTLNVSLLTNAGFGVSLRSAGVDVASTLTNTALSVNLLTANSGTISLNYTATAPVAGTSIGITLFTGQGSGLASIGALGDLSFDNVALSAIPEPSTCALWGGAVMLGAALYFRRKNHG